MIGISKKRLGTRNRMKGSYQSRSSICSNLLRLLSCKYLTCNLAGRYTVFTQYIHEVNANVHRTRIFKVLSLDFFVLSKRILEKSNESTMYITSCNIRSRLDRNVQFSSLGKIVRTINKVPNKTNSKFFV